MTTLINIYQKISETKNGQNLPFDIFLDNIKDGKWQDFVLPIRAMKDEEEQKAAKRRVPYVTISGTFRERLDNAIIQHSGFIGVDIDDIDPEETKSIICPDPYVYAAFTSIRGKGICAVFKINGEKHREAYTAISEYLFDKYQLVTDPTSVNSSRARFVSFDPHLHLNQGAEKFTAIPKKKADKKVPEIIFVQTDFDLIIQEIQSRNIDLTPTYDSWLKIGFALAEKFGEGGRDYFHAISYPSASYNRQLCDRQYTNCLKAKKSGITIGSFYYLAKQAGIKTVSAQTKLISQAAHFAKKGARKRDSAIEYLKEAEGISEDISTPIVDQVFDSNITVNTSESPIESVEIWLNQDYSLRRNVITRMLEDNGRDVEEEDLNSIFIAAKKVFDKEITSEILTKLIFSRFIQDFNPFQEFFEKYSSRKPKGVIASLFNTIETDTGITGGEFFPQYKEYFGTKWTVGLISAMHGKHSPLMIVLSGNKQGTGKTEFWNLFLPVELRKYFGESKLDKGTDSEILMTQKLLLLDDEMSAKDDREIAQFKRLTSKQVFSLRAPYGKHNIDLKRLAVLCGTTQENEILSDPTGNRRIIPINVLSINQAAYNAIDKIDLIMEAYWLYKDGFNWQLSTEDVGILGDNTGYFQRASAEYDLIQKYFRQPENDREMGYVFMSPTEIKSELEKRSMQKLNHIKLGMELKRLGYVKESKRDGFRAIKGYGMIDIQRTFVDS